MKQEATKGDGSLEESNQPSYKEYEEESTVVFRTKRDDSIPFTKRSSTLPAGWQKLTDNLSGRQYYYNEDTKESQWKLPRVSLYLETPQNKVRKGYKTRCGYGSCYIKYVGVIRKTDIPPGWTTEKDESNEDVFVNSVSDEKWKACKTENGNTYYYKVGEDVTAWKLPDIEVKARGPRRRSFDGLADDKLSSRMSSTFPRNSKCKSVLFDFPISNAKSQEDIKVPAPKPSVKLHRRSQSASMLLEDDDIPSVRVSMVNGKAVKIPDVEGYLARKKLVEGGKSKKGHWEQVYVCKYENILVFYKDKKSSIPKPDFPDGKPESSIDLRGAVLQAPSIDKTKGKKNVFQISTYNNSTVMMLMADTPTAMGNWLTPMQLTIKDLEEQTPLPTVPPPIITDGGKKLAVNTSSSVSGPLSPTTPTMQRNNKVDKADKPFKGIGRRLSKRPSNVNEDEVNKSKIRDKLKKFLPKRPTYYELEKKGIIKQEIYGCHLDVLCKRDNSTVPKFVVKCIDEIEKRGKLKSFSLHVRGIYRECGNASLMHKLRISTDQGEHIDFEDKQWADIHVIAGALKWYFRELPEPLIPADVFDDFIEGIKNPSIHERRRKFKTLIDALPSYNYDTLKLLLQHLLKVTEFSSENKMEKHNCSIVFGPTLLRPEEEESQLNIALNTVYQNQIVNFLLSEYAELFSSA
eukprot:gene14707-5804_t